MSIPSTTQAVVVVGTADCQVQTVPAPRLRDDYLLVQTKAVALNPTDWKTSSALFGTDVIDTRVGCDYAGVVLAVGPKAAGNFQVGDRIAGGAHGSNLVEHEDGAFAGIIAVRPEIAFKIPAAVSDEDAATYGLVTTTVALSFYGPDGLGLTTPWAATKTKADGEFVLIYGASSATGLVGVQFAKLAGYRVLTTASQHNAAYLESLGADEVFDYHDVEAAQAGIKAALGGAPLRYAWDCVSDATSAAFCATAMAGSSADVTSLAYVSLLPIDFAQLAQIDARVNGRFVFYYDVFGEAFEKWAKFPAKPEVRAFAHDFWVHTGRLIADGKLKGPRAYVNRGGAGLEGILTGLQELKNNKVSGGKLVYTL